MDRSTSTAEGCRPPPRPWETRHVCRSAAVMTTAPLRVLDMRACHCKSLRNDSQAAVPAQAGMGSFGCGIGHFCSGPKASSIVGVAKTSRRAASRRHPLRRRWSVAAARPDRHRDAQPAAARTTRDRSAPARRRTTAEGAANQHAADRSGDAAALLGGLELGYRLTSRRETGREEPLVPVAHHDAPAVARELSARSWA